MHLLILCQDTPLDKYVIEAAVADGHRITLLSQEMGHAYRFPGAKVLTGDRLRDHSLLNRWSWDAVIDLHATMPAELSVATAALNGNAAHYTLLSSISVLPASVPPGADESAEVVRLTPEQAREWELTAENAAGNLAECERVLSDYFAGTFLIARRGFVVIPDDERDPVARWLARLGTRRQVVVPRPERPVQLIDVRDLARWLVRSTEARYEGTLFVTGPTEPMTLGDFVSASARVVDGAVDVLLGVGHGIVEDSLADLPHWMLTASAGQLSVDTSEALFKGLGCRPVEETLFDVHAWESLMRRYRFTGQP